MRTYLKLLIGICAACLNLQQGSAEILFEQPAGTVLVNSSGSSNFGSATLGSNGATLTFTVRNTGATEVADLSVTVEGAAADDFTIPRGALPRSLAGGSAVTFPVTFRPWQSGSRSASLRITSDDPAANPFIISLNGTGVVQAGPGQSIQVGPMPAVLDTGGAPFQILACATSGLPLSYAVLTGPAVVSAEGLLSPTGASGPVTVRIHQAGGESYTPAESMVTVHMAASQQFVTLSRGSQASHSAGIRADGSLWMWGENDKGQLGDGTLVARLAPVRVGEATNWIAVACGRYHTLALQSDGSLWAWGNNSSYELGDGTKVPRTAPGRVGTANTWVSIACGGNHSLARKSDGTLWAWGDNVSGQLGLGTTSSGLTPVKVGSATDWAFVTSGDAHSMALKTDGSLWAWGKNNHGQYGNGLTTESRSPIQIGTATDWRTISCSDHHTMALKADGSLWGWGSNMSGELGDNTTTARPTPGRVGTDADWVDVVCNKSGFTTARKSDGSLWGWGNNFIGQLADGTVTDRRTPVRSGDASVWVELGNGGGYAFATQSDGSLWAWGYNSVGQLGEFSNGRMRPTAIGGAGGCTGLAFGIEHAAAVKADGTLWTWGKNNYSQLGDGTTAMRLSAGQVGTATNWSSIGCGRYHSVALKSNGTLWAWGGNNDGQLGTGSTTWYSSPIQVGSATDWTAFACGSNHNLAIKSDGSLWSWGAGVNGKLGYGSASSRNAPGRVGTGTSWVSVACGAEHSMAIQSDGSLWAWGYNFYGRLGDGTSTPSSTPVRVAPFATWAKVSCGSSHTAALTTDGSLYVWGENNSGQIGDGTNGAWFSPTRIGAAGGWLHVACGMSHTMAIARDGTLWAWGSNTSGQLGHGTFTISKIPCQVGSGNGWKSLPASLGELVSGALSVDGTIWTCGATTTAQLAIPSVNSTKRVWPARAPQSVTLASFAPIMDGQSVTLAATADSRLPVVKSVEGPAILNGDALTRTAGGKIKVGIWQGGDATWLNSDPQAVTAPLVLTMAPTSVEPTEAILSGVIHPNGLESEVWVEYGPTTTYGSRVNLASLPPGGTGGQSVSASVGGLAPGATYHYRFAASNGLGTGLGEDRLLTTAPALAVEQAGTTLASGSSVVGFGGTMLGTTGGTLTFTVSNKGSMPLEVMSAALDDGGSGEYHLNAASLPATLAAGGKRTFTITFRPLLAGPRVSRLRISSSDPLVNPFEIVLSGTGLAGSSPTQTIGVMPPAAVNTGSAPFQLFAAATSGHPLTYSVVTGPATVDGDGLVTLTGGTGGVTIKVSQSGGAGFAPVETYVTFRVTDGLDFVSFGAGSVASHSAGIRSNGTLWTWGKNDGGQLGNGTKTNSTDAIQVTSSNNWSSVACGYLHTVAVKKDGSLWAWGSNGGGQLGDGTTTERLTPVRIGTDNDWVNVATGQYHTVALKSDGSMWAWGSNGYGQVGNGDTTNQSAPVRIGNPGEWKSVQCGISHAVAMKLDGSMWAWGNNDSGQLGDGTTNPAGIPQQVGQASGWRAVACGSSRNVAVKDDGTLWAWGSGPLGDGVSVTRIRPIQVGTDANWQAVACGSGHIMAIKEDGSLWSWGDNSNKQLGYLTLAWSQLSPGRVGSENDWQSVVACGSHTFATRSDRTVWAWGLNTSGQLGFPTDAKVFTPVTAWGSNKCVSAAAGFNFATAVTDDGKLWGMGYNGQSQVGQNEPERRYAVPVRIGASTTWVSVASGLTHSVALDVNGMLWAWGNGDSGRLGDGSVSNRTYPNLVQGGSNWAAAACGNNHTLGLKKDGSLWSWGYNPYGALGDGSTTNRNSPVRVGTGTNWKMVAGGNYHTAGITTDGKLWAWGYNASGQLGDTTTIDRNVPTQVGTESNWNFVACGESHTVGIKTDGSIWAWGANGNGQLGDGTTTLRKSPVRIGSDSDWATVGCGPVFTLAVKSDGTLWAWGSNSGGQFGDNTTTQRNSPVQVGTANGWSRPLLTLGDRFAMVLTSAGDLWSCGLNADGQLGIVDPALPKRIWPDRLPQAIGFPPLPVLGIGHPVAVGASVESGLPLRLGVSGPAGLNGNFLMPTGIGAVKVTAWQKGDATWNHSDPMCRTQSVVGVRPLIAVATSSNKSATTLTFTGMVNPGGLATTAYFEYGTTGDYGSVAPVTLAKNDGASSQAVTATVTGLTPGATYQFRLIASNGSGASVSENLQASTLQADPPSPPTVTLALSGSPLLEEGGVATVSAALSSPRAYDVTVQLGFSGTAQWSSDYQRSNTSITIPAGATEGEITLTAIQDLLFENPDDSIAVDVESVINGSEDGTQRVVATIRDDDLRGFPLVAGQRGLVSCLANSAVSYDVYLPPSYGANQTPLSILYTCSPSGGGSVSDFQTVAANLGIIVVGLTATQNGVSWDTIIRELHVVAGDIRQRVCFDPSAEMVSGFSGMGVASYGFSRIRPAHVAGIYPMGGWMGRDGIYYPQDRVPTGLLVARSTGTSDFGAQAYTSADRNFLTSCGAIVTDWDFVGGHQIAPDEQKSSALSWILSHRVIPPATDRAEASVLSNQWHARIVSGESLAVLREAVQVLSTRPRSWFAYHAQQVLDQLVADPFVLAADVDDLAQGDVIWDHLYFAARGAALNGDAKTYQGYMKLLTGVSGVSWDRSASLDSNLALFGFPVPAVHLAHEGNELRLSFTKESPGLKYTLETNSDLAAGGWQAVSSAVVETDTEWSTTIIMPAEQPKGFFRVRVVP